MHRPEFHWRLVRGCRGCCEDKGTAPHRSGQREGACRSPSFHEAGIRPERCSRKRTPDPGPRCRQWEPVPPTGACSPMENPGRRRGNRVPERQRQSVAADCAAGSESEQEVLSPRSGAPERSNLASPLTRSAPRSQPAACARHSSGLPPLNQGRASPGACLWTPGLRRASVSLSRLGVSLRDEPRSPQHCTFHTRI